MQQQLRVACIPVRHDGGDELHVLLERGRAVEAHLLGGERNVPLG